MSSGYIPPKDEPGLDDILDALREALAHNPRVAEVPAEKLARQLVLRGHLEKEPSPTLVAEALQSIEAEEGNPT